MTMTPADLPSTTVDSLRDLCADPAALEVKPPKVSVCIPAYQAQDYLQRVLDSVFGQTYGDFEVLVVDNNSSDATPRILDAIDDPRLRVIRNPTTVPFVDNFNLAVRHARGEFVKVICVDDLLKPDCIAAQASVLDGMPDVALVSVKCDFIDDDDRLIAPARGLSRIEGRVPAQQVVKRIVHSGANPVGAPLAGMFRRADFDRVGGFTADFPFASDLDLWVRLLGCGDFYGVPAAHASFRVRSGSMSGLTSLRAQLTQALALGRSVSLDPRWELAPADLLRGRLRCYEQTVRRAALFGITNWRVRQRSRQSLPTIATPDATVGEAAVIAVETLTTVICAYTPKRWNDLCRAVESALAQNIPAHDVILVIDHCPRLYRLASEHFASRGRVTVLESDQENGLSGARNTGVSAARGDVVAFLDDDAAAEEGWARSLMRHYQDPRVAAVGGYATPVWPEGGRPEWMPAEFDWVVGCSYIGQPDTLTTVRNPLGCNMSIRRSVFAEVGGFRSEVGRVGTHPVGGEETELCMRIGANDPSARILFDPEAIVQHHVSVDRTTLSYFRRRCYHEGMSKAVVTDLAGVAAPLATERAYTTSVLPRGVVRELLSRNSGWLQRVGAIVFGLGATAVGYGHAKVIRRLRNGTS
jgi:glycosyltransferase involved in cell wall biosynthesis